MVEIATTPVCVSGASLLVCMAWNWDVMGEMVEMDGILQVWEGFKAELWRDPFASSTILIPKNTCSLYCKY